MKHVQDSPRPDRADSGASVLPAHRVLAAFALHEDVEQLVTSYLDELRNTLPQLRPWRGFSSGRWVIGAHTVPDHGSPLPSDYSRVDFEISVDSATPAVELTCRSTVRGRDRQQRTLAVPLDAHGREQLAGWIESALLDFATGWYQRGAQAPPTN